jgi:dihydrofolate reductase
VVVSEFITVDGVLDGELSTFVRTLNDELDGDVLVNGSIRLVRDLLANDLVDELRLMVFPILLGNGRRLFEDETEPISLRPLQGMSARETTILTYGRSPEVERSS